MSNNDRYSNPALIAIILVVFLMFLVVWTLLTAVNVHGQSLPVIPKETTKPDIFKMSICSDEALGPRVGLHAPELTSCDDFIAWQNEVADNLGIPRLASVNEGLSRGLLVPVASTKYLDVSRVPAATRYVAPQVKEFLEKVAVEFYNLRHKRLPLKSLVRFYETRTEERNSIHRRGLAADITCRYMNQGDVDALRKILIRERQNNSRVQPTEESYEALWIKRRINKVITYHVTVFNASFMTPY